MPAALRRDAANPLGLRHPGLVAMPLALRLSAPVPTMGARRVAVAKSAYAVRIEANGQLVDWDRSLSRTQLERIALVERVLAELGAEPVPPRRGGWSVSGR